jgi:hypothetical protein
VRQVDKSIPLFEGPSTLREKKLGRDHTETLKTEANLGVKYQETGRLQEVIGLRKTTLPRQVTDLGKPARPPKIRQHACPRNRRSIARATIPPGPIRNSTRDEGSGTLLGAKN